MRILDHQALRVKGITLSTTQIWRLEKAGKFPKSFKFGGGLRKCWDEDDIDAYLEACKAAAADREVAA